MNKKITLNIYNYKSLKELWEDTINDAFDELESMIDELDLSTSTIKNLLGVLYKDKNVLLNNMMLDVIEEED